MENVKPDSPSARGVGLEERFDRPFTSSIGGECTLDGVYVPCDMAVRAFRSGGAVQCPDNNCGPTRVDINTSLIRGESFLTRGVQVNAAGEWSAIMTGNQRGMLEGAMIEMGMLGAGDYAMFFAPGESGKKKKGKKSAGGENLLLELQDDPFYKGMRDWYKQYYVNPYFDDCGGSNYFIKKSNGEIIAQMGKEQAAIALAGATDGINVSAAEIAAEWLQESNWE